MRSARSWPKIATKVSKMPQPPPLDVVTSRSTSDAARGARRVAPRRYAAPAILACRRSPLNDSTSSTPPPLGDDDAALLLGPVASVAFLQGAPPRGGFTGMHAHLAGSRGDVRARLPAANLFSSSQAGVHARLATCQVDVRASGRFASKTVPRGTGGGGDERAQEAFPGAVRRGNILVQTVRLANCGTSGGAGVHRRSARKRRPQCASKTARNAARGAIRGPSLPITMTQSTRPGGKGGGIKSVTSSGRRRSGKNSKK